MSETGAQASGRVSSGLSAAVGWGALALACVWGFWASGRLHGGYRLDVVGLEFIPASELVFYMWYALWGLPAMVFGVRALLGSGLAEALARGCAPLLGRPTLWLSLAAGSALVASLAFFLGLTQGLPLSDDEKTYAFIARTLLRGRVVNPLPAAPELFHNVFVVLNGSGWYGKYPIGHPLVLALGEAVGLRALVVPGLSALNLLLTYRVGRVFFDARTAFCGALLLLLSPHYIWTHGTQLSQPTSMACMLLGILALARTLAGGAVSWALLAGALFGFGVLVRPMPGCLFVAAAAVAFFVHGMRGRSDRARQRRWIQLIAAGAVTAVFVAALLAVHRAQSGDALESGYHAASEVPLGPTGLLFTGSAGAWATSLGGALMRESFWFLGFPGAVALCFWARVRSLPALFWGLLVAVAAYRILVPKTVLSVTGPVYVTEALPLLALAAADVLLRLSRQYRGQRHAGALAVAVVLTGALVSASMFLPVQVGPVTTATRLSGRVYDQLHARGATRALVFADHLVSPQDRRTWSYFPPNPSPDLDDDILFVRVPPGDAAQRRARAVAYWREHMSDRRAFLFVPELHETHLLELTP